MTSNIILYGKNLETASHASHLTQSTVLHIGVVFLIIPRGIISNAYPACQSVVLYQYGLCELKPSSWWIPLMLWFKYMWINEFKIYGKSNISIRTIWTLSSLSFTSYRKIEIRNIRGDKFTGIKNIHWLSCSYVACTYFLPYIIDDDWSTTTDGHLVE